jgi:serine/threonine-protein kinase RsbW
MPSKGLPRCDFNAEDLVLRARERLSAEVASIGPTVEKVMAIVREQGCAAGREVDIEIALSEALANAITHGCADDPCGEVECCVACDSSRGLLLVVRDTGPGFDPSSLPSPTVGENLFSDHGRGIFLINQLVDDVRFESGGTEIHMVVRPKEPSER